MPIHQLILDMPMIYILYHSSDNKTPIKIDLGFRRPFERGLKADLNLLINPSP